MNDSLRSIERKLERSEHSESKSVASRKSTSSANSVRKRLSASAFMNKYERMVESQLSEEDATITYLKPLYEQLVDIGKDPLDDSQEITSDQTLLYSQCALALETNGLFKTDEQLMLVLKELASCARIKQENGGENSSNTGLTFIELLHCYRIVVVGMLVLDRMRVGSKEREQTKLRCLQMVRLFLPMANINDGFSKVNKDSLQMDEVKQILTSKDWQLVNLIDEHAAEIEDLTDIIMKGKRAYGWTQALRFGSILTLLGVGFGLYAHQNGYLGEIASPPIKEETIPLTKATCSEDKNMKLAIKKCQKEKGNCQQSLSAAEEDKKKDLSLISSMQQSEIKMNSKINELQISFDVMKKQVQDYEKSEIQKNSQIEKLEEQKQEGLGYKRNFDEAKSMLQQLKKKNLDLELEMKDLQSSLTICKERMKFIETERNQFLSQINDSATSLNLCLSRLSDEQLKAREANEARMITEVPPPTQISDEKKPKGRLSKIIRGVLVTYLIAVVVPNTINAILIAIGRPSAGMASAAVKAGKMRKVANAKMKAEQRGFFLSNVFGAMKGFFTRFSWTQFFKIF